jgi:hypothetical protein
MDNPTGTDQTETNLHTEVAPPSSSWLPMAIGVGTLMAILVTLLTVL